MLDILCHEVGRHLDGLFIVVACNMYERAVRGVRRQTGLKWPELLQEPPDGRISKLLVRQSTQRCELSTTGRAASGRHIRLLIPDKQRRRRAEVVDLHQPRFEFLKCCFHPILLSWLPDS